MVLVVNRPVKICEAYYAIFRNAKWYYLEYGYSHAFPTLCMCNSICTLNFLVNPVSDAGRSITYWYNIGIEPYKLMISLVRRRRRQYMVVLSYYYLYNGWVNYHILTRIYTPSNTYFEHKVKMVKKTLSLSKRRSLLTIVPSMMSNLI